MGATLTLANAQIRTDLATFLGRAGRIEDAGVRLQEVSNGVACWVPVLRPAGLLTDSPLVVGVRGIPARIESDETDDLVDGRVDVVVPMRGMLDRLAREPGSGLDATRLPLPPERSHESWTGVTPPLTGWVRTASLSNDILIGVAEDGIAEVGERVGGGLGQILAEKIRTNTWTRSLPELARRGQETSTGESTSGLEPHSGTLPPAGAAFAAHALGFLKPGGTGQLSEAPGWWRLAFPAGQVLIRRR